MKLKDVSLISCVLLFIVLAQMYVMVENFVAPNLHLYSLIVVVALSIAGITFTKCRWQMVVVSMISVLLTSCLFFISRSVIKRFDTSFKSKFNEISIGCKTNGRCPAKIEGWQEGGKVSYYSERYFLYRLSLSYLMLEDKRSFELRGKAGNLRFFSRGP